MSAYRKLINQLVSKNMYKPETDLKPGSDFKMEDEILSKIEKYKENMPLFELLFTDALKKNQLEYNQINVDLSDEEKEKILELVIDIIEQFEKLDKKT